MDATPITINIDFTSLIIIISTIVGSLLIIVWKGKQEISDTMDNKLKPFGNIANAINEIQTILRINFRGISIVHSMVENRGSPLNPTAYGTDLIKRSGLEKILNDNKELLCTKLKASLPKEYTEYDVQEKARELLVSLKDDSIMSPVKNWVYNNPMEINTILRVGGLWLRDDFLNMPHKISATETSEE